MPCEVWANLSSVTTPDPAEGHLIYAASVTDLRSELHDALVALNITTSNYTDNTITANVTVIKAVHIRESRARATSGAGDTSSGGSNGGLISPGSQAHPSTFHRYG